MSVEGIPAQPDEKQYYTWVIFRTADGIPFLGLLRVVDGKPQLNQVLRLSYNLEEFENLYHAIKVAMEGGGKRPVFYG